jgi:hypothetical protein
MLSNTTTQADQESKFWRRVPNPPPTPFERFQERVSARAKVLLEDNKARLNAEQKAYLEENNPNSDRWRQLRQVASQRQQFRRQEQEVRSQIRANEALFQEAQLAYRSDPRAFLHGTETPAQREAKMRHPLYQRLLQLEAQRRTMDQKLRFSRQAQSALEYEYPALAAIPRELGTSPEAIRQAQQSIPKKFDQIRGDIDTVYRDLSRDSSLGLRMDAAVQDVLARIKDPKQAALFAQRVKEEEARRQLPAQVLGIASGVGFVASIFAPPLLPLATSLGAAATVAGAAEIPGLMTMLAAANAGSGGKPLTNQTVDEARFNLTMAWADVAMAGLEVGLETKALQRLASAGGRLAVGGLRLSRPQWKQTLQAAQRSPAELDLYLATLKDLSPEAKQILRESVTPNVRTQGIPEGPKPPSAGTAPQPPKPGTAPKPPKPAKPEGAKPKPKPDERVPVPQRTPKPEASPVPQPTPKPPERTPHPQRTPDPQQMPLVEDEVTDTDRWFTRHNKKGNLLFEVKINKK